MLVLGIEQGEWITLRWHGEEVRILVKRDGCNRTRLGFEAPRHIQILRDDAVDRSPPIKTGAPHRIKQMGPEKRFKNRERQQQSAQRESQQQSEHAAAR